MYIYFDANGTIKEIVNDKSIRQGSTEANKIYCYIEGNPTIDDIWYMQKLPSGETSNEVSFKNSTVTKAIPYDAKRDMRYFKDFEQYTFYVRTLNAFLVSQKGLNLATIRIVVDNEIFALGELTFNVQENVINVDNGITISQYDYLLLAYASRTLNEVTANDLDALLDDKINAKIGDLANGSPKVFDTEYNIEHMHDDEGIAVATDTGYIYVWNDTQEQYISTGMKYIADVSLFYTKTETDTLLANKADKSTAITHTGNQLQDYSGNNIYPNVIINNFDENIIELLDGNTRLIGNIIVNSSNVGFLKTDGTFSTDANYHCKYTNFIICSENEVFLYRGYGYYWGASAIYYDKDFNIISYEQSSSSANYQKYTTPTNTKYIRFCSYANIGNDVVFDAKPMYSILKSIEENKTNNLYATTNIIPFEERTGYLKTDGTFASDANYHCKYTDYLSCEAGDKFIYTGFGTYSGASAIYYNSNYEIISYEQSSSKTVCRFYVCPTNTKYVRFSSFDNSSNPIVFEVNKIDNLVKSPLNQKKWCVFGDSFTAGDTLGKYKAYPSLICNRNKMILQDFSANGTYIHYGDASPLKNTNAYYYQNIDADVDYITIAYGLNELSTTIGDKTSNDNTTIWGAYNELLTWLITNRPNAKIGIISNDSWMNVTMRNTLQAIALRFGVAFLDLKGKNVPLMIGGKYSEDNTDINSDIVTLRNTQYKISNDNSHPNELGHKVRSYIIEDWLKGI